MANRSRQTAKAATKKPTKITVLAPKTAAQRDYIRRGNVSADVASSAHFLHFAADEGERRFGGSRAELRIIADMRRCARRLDLLSRSLKRVVRHA